MDLRELSARVEYVSAGYADYYGVARTDEWVALKLVEEVGELVQSLLTLNGSSRDRGLDAEQKATAVADELADTLAMVLVLAHRLGVDVEDAVVRKWFRYEQFHHERGFSVAEA